MANYASLTTRECWLGKEFGEQFAIRQFGQEIVNSLPRVTRGKNKDKHKASIRWVKVEKGGWVHKGSDDTGALGYVETRVGQVIACQLIVKEWGSERVEVLHSKGENLF